jgi:hypothetical protein
MKLNRDTKNQLIRRLETGDTAISTISKDLKSSAQSKELADFVSVVKSNLAKNRSVVLVAISSIGEIAKL